MIIIPFREHDLLSFPCPLTPDIFRPYKFPSARPELYDLLIPFFSPSLSPIFHLNSRHQPHLHPRDIHTLLKLHAEQKAKGKATCNEQTSTTKHQTHPFSQYTPMPPNVGNWIHVTVALVVQSIDED